MKCICLEAVVIIRVQNQRWPCVISVTRQLVSCFQRSSPFLGLLETLASLVSSNHEESFLCQYNYRLYMALKAYSCHPSNDTSWTASTKSRHPVEVNENAMLHGENTQHRRVRLMLTPQKPLTPLDAGWNAPRYLLRDTLKIPVILPSANRQRLHLISAVQCLRLSTNSALTTPRTKGTESPNGCDSLHRVILSFQQVGHFF